MTMQHRFSLRMGESAPVEASSDTFAFLQSATSREVQVAGAGDGGLVLATGRSGQLVLAASARARPGQYTAQVSATNAAGETRQTSVEVDVAPRVTVPLNSTRNPVVLLNGWETGFTNGCPVSNSSSDTFGNLAQYLIADGVPVVYFFDNCLEDPNASIETLAVDLADFLQTIQYDNGTQVPQIDLVGFSMGGLIARAYLAGLQPDESLLPPSPNLAGKLVLIATPNFGSFVAGNYSSFLQTGSQSSEIEPGSGFLWNLANWNQRSDDLQGVNAIAVIGNAGAYVPSLSAGTALNNASDGMVSLTSAALGFVAQQTSTTRIVPYCHVDPSTFVNANFGTYQCNAPGIANITSTNHPTSRIVRSFLAGTTDWQSIGTTPDADPYLSKNGGMFFALVGSTGVYASDVTQVGWGNLQLINGADTGVIYYADFVSGTGAFTAASTSLGNFNCGTYAQPAGYFSALRCKINAAVFSVAPLLTKSPKVVTAGGAITIGGADFSGKCINCQVTVTPSGSSSPTPLQVNSWSNNSITAVLPSNMTGFMTLTVFAVTGTDALTFFAATPGAAAIAVSPQNLQFNYTIGGGAPDAQTVQLTNSGGGTLSWTAAASDSWISVTPDSGTAPSSLSISVTPANLAPGTYNGAVQATAAGASNTPLSIPVTLTVGGTPGAPPLISGVTNAADFQTTIAPATWISIFGSNLSADTYTWQSSDIVNNHLPASLHNVSVTVNGMPAYISYLSATQINALAPDDSTIGPVQVQVTVGGQTSEAFTVTQQALSPAFFAVDSAGHAAALHADYTPVNAASPAQPGETIQIYATGFGPTNPASPTSQLVTAPQPLAVTPQVTIGGTPASVAFAGLVESGTYQLNMVVPILPAGDASVQAVINGVVTKAGALLPVAGQQ